MSNHCYMHFNEPITIDRVHTELKSYCEKRLGNETLVSRHEDIIIVKLPGFLNYPLEARYWLKDDYTMEHKHIHDHPWSFGVRLFQYIGWKLGASHLTDESIPDKMNPHYFLSRPTMLENLYTHQLQVGYQEQSLEIFNEIFPKKTHTPYDNEEDYVSPLNRLCAFWYAAPEDPYECEKPYWREMESMFHKRLGEIKKILDFTTKDCFYGTPLRAALSNSNYKLASWLIDQGIEVKDEISLGSYAHPPYIQQSYFQDISMPLLNMVMVTLEENSKPDSLYTIINKLIKKGANPLSIDSRDMDAIDCFFNNRVANAEQSEVIFKAFMENVQKGVLADKIQASNLSEKKKQEFLNSLEVMEFKKKMTLNIMA